MTKLEQCEWAKQEFSVDSVKASVSFSWVEKFQSSKLGSINTITWNKWKNMECIL